MDVGYVEMIEDMTPGLASTYEVRAEVDRLLAEAVAASPVRRVDRDAWLRGREAAQGQTAMLELATGTRSRTR